MRSEKPSSPCQFVALCLDRADGKVLWQKTLREEVPHEGHHPQDGTFASGSPIVDGESLFAFFGSRGLYRLDLSGNVLWSKDLGKMQIKNSFGEGASPALAGKSLVVCWDHEGDDFIAAFDKETGKELWRQPREEDTAWATPLAVEFNGKLQVVTSATRRIRSYDAETGTLLWQCGGMTANAIPSPVADDKMVYLTSGFRGSALLAIKLGGSGELTDSDSVAWRLSKATPYVPSPLLYRGNLYFFSGNNGMLSCVEAATGKVLVNAERLEALQGVYASPVAADGRVYLVGRNGATLVLAASGKLDVLATNRLEDRFDSSPALAGGDLFLRGRGSLYCLGGK